MPILSEWLEIMLGEIRRKREESERAPADERELRSGAGQQEALPPGPARPKSAPR